MIENKDFMLNIAEVEPSIKKTLTYLKQRQEIIEKMKNITEFELAKGYQSSLNKTIEKNINLLIAKLKDINIQQLKNYMEMKNELMILSEIKNKNIQSFLDSETELLH